MSSRILSFLLAACLLCLGLTAAAKPVLAAPVVGTQLASLDQGTADPGPASEEDIPFTPTTPSDRDDAVDQPELFDDLHWGTGPADVAPRPPSLGASGPAAPYLQGLRRPPRGPLSS